MIETKQYTIRGNVYDVAYHYEDDTQRNKHITNSEVRFTRISVEMGRRFFGLELLDEFKMIVELQEYEKLTGKLPKLPFDFNNFKIGLIYHGES